MDKRSFPRSGRIVACRTLARNAVGHHHARTGRHSTASSKIAFCCRSRRFTSTWERNLGLLKHPQAGVAFHANIPPFALNAPRWNRHFRVIHAAAVQTIRGGQAANVVSVDGSHFRIQLGYISNTVATSAGDGAGGTFTQSTPTPASTIIQPTEFPQPIGTVRVYAMPNGEVGIIVDGSNDNTELTINPLPHPIRKGYAHSYAYGQSGVTHILNIGQITVNSGSIGAIEGFHTANLVGPLVASGTTTVDRIAFNSIESRRIDHRRRHPEHARRSPGHHPEHRAQHQHPDRPRPQLAERRWEHRPRKRIV